jgi:hypothetical protein
MIDIFYTETDYFLLFFDTNSIIVYFKIMDKKQLNPNLLQFYCLILKHFIVTTFSKILVSN